MSQNSLMQAINTIKDIARTSGTKEKATILKQGDSEDLRVLLYYTYNKFITYRVKQIEQPETYAAIQPDTLGEFRKLCDTLAAHKWGTTEALHNIKKFLGMNTPDVAEVYTNVLLRDIRAGIDVKSINRAFPGLVPTFDIQLGYALDTWDRIKYPIVYEEKIDGIRCVAVSDGNRVKFYSRKGFEFETGMDCFAEQILKMAPGFPMVLDAEFRAFKYNKNDATCVKHKNGNWKFEYAKGISRRKVIPSKEIATYFKLYIWDVVPYDYFVSQGKEGSCAPLGDRKIQLHALFHRHEGEEFPNLEEVSGYVARGKAEIDAFMQKMKEQGLEGCMLKPIDLKYSFSKNWNIIKLKHFVEADFRIIGATEAAKGTKYEGLLGSLTLATDDGKLKTNMGSGFTDLDRAELWNEFLSGRLTGRIVEIQLKDITADGSIQLPTLIRFRDDKDTTDALEDIQAKLKFSGSEDE